LPAPRRSNYCPPPLLNFRSPQMSVFIL
jgi:hypothetical protein